MLKEAFCFAYLHLISIYLIYPSIALRLTERKYFPFHVCIILYFLPFVSRVRRSFYHFRGSGLSNSAIIEAAISPPGPLPDSPPSSSSRPSTSTSASQTLSDLAQAATNQLMAENSSTVGQVGSSRESSVEREGGVLAAAAAAAESELGGNDGNWRRALDERRLRIRRIRQAALTMRESGMELSRSGGRASSWAVERDPPLTGGGPEPAASSSPASPSFAERTAPEAMADHSYYRR